MITKLKKIQKELEILFKKEKGDNLKEIKVKNLLSKKNLI